jgi:hypothetical protein
VVVNDIRRGSVAKFPISASDLPHLTGRVLGEKLASIKADWLSSDLEKTKIDLLGG